MFAALLTALLLLNPVAGLSVDGASTPPLAGTCITIGPLPDVPPALAGPWTICLPSP